LRGLQRSRNNPRGRHPATTVEEEAPELDEVEELQRNCLRWSCRGRGELEEPKAMARSIGGHEDEVDFDEPSKADPDDEWDNTDASDVSFDDE